MPRYDRHIDRILNAQRIVGLMARLPHCCWRDASDGVAGDGAATMYRSSLKSRRDARNAKKAERVQSAVNTENVYSCEFLFAFVCMNAWGIPDLFWNFREPCNPPSESIIPTIGDMMVKLWFG